MILRGHALRFGKRLIRNACLKLPLDIAVGYYEEWTAELPAILDDRDVRHPSVRILRALAFAADQYRSVRKLAPDGSRRVARGLMLSLTAIAFTLGLVGGVGVGVVILLATSAGYLAGIILNMMFGLEPSTAVDSIILAIVAGGYFAAAGIVILGELLDTTNDETLIRAALFGALIGAVAVAALVMTLVHWPIGVIALCISSSGIVPATKRLVVAYRCAYPRHYQVMSIEEEG
ncbi:hypothetical protein [Nonomuraea fuscirosea]|uniref:hypothetical protein n=1 Tax=Nonomuraea fuscirosea TaxID=1291556 RepID=UPI0034163CF1